MPPVETPPEALDLRESFAATALVEGDSPIQPDGTVLMHIIRPGIGRGRGRHLYEAKMLEENAHKFGAHTLVDGSKASGWKQYVNHLSPEAKKAAGGLPRDVRDLGGRIVESWWDPDVPASDRFGQGAVVARAKPTPFMRTLIENDPEIVEASISATATGVKRGEHQGQPCWIVEGIEDRGSVDWVTEAGAGGRVVSLIEAALEDDADGHLALLASFDDDEFTQYLRDERPEIAEAMARPEQPVAEPRSPEEDEMEITPDMLQEALADETLRGTLLEALDLAGVVEAQVEQVLGEALPSLIESAVEAERDVIRATARADADRRVQIERMRSQAHGLIEATRLPDVFKTDLKTRFDLTENGPTPALDVIDEIDGDGAVAKRAEDKLGEAVKAEIDKAQQMFAAANPARVTAQGPAASGDEPVQQTVAPKGSLVEALLTEAGFKDPDKVYDADTALQG